MRKSVIGLICTLLVSCKTNDIYSNSELNEVVQEDSDSIVYYDKKFPPVPSDELAICSFNITFLGHFKTKANEALTDLVENCDGVLIQELVAPPWDITFPNGESSEGDVESLAFVNAMKQHFDGLKLSEENTGKNSNHASNPEAEYFIFFYKKKKLEIASDLPQGFLAEPRVKNPVFDRVPYAFGVRAVGSKKTDFVLVSVHLKATEGSGAVKQGLIVDRLKEWYGIKSWIDQQESAGSERDFFIVGDTNIEYVEEVDAITGNDIQPLLKKLTNTDVRKAFEGGDNNYLRDFKTLNYSFNAAGKPQMQKTNVTNTPKAFDHVFYHPGNSKEVEENFEIVDITKLFPFSNNIGTYKGPYSDHNPIRFRLKTMQDDD
ncbi:MAG: hypothetical protein AB7T49_03890 [Oligoflexales bacterium]